jgi:fumarate hydratase, class II
MKQETAFRSERDTMGEVRVPVNAYYGPQTARAVENFPISGLRFPRPFLWALGLVKAVAAQSNIRLRLLDPLRGDAIVQAASEVANGRFDQEFVVDVFQTGSGTSTHMNANEVIARRASEILRATTNDTTAIHPNDHVNIGQSSNDVFPTVIHVAAVAMVERHLLPALHTLSQELATKAIEFADIVKAARTHLQDAVPITLGQEFSGYASVIKHGIRSIEAVTDHLAELPLGGTAVGTGLNAHPQFAPLAIAELNKRTGLRFRAAENNFEAMQNRDACVETSAAVKTVAIGLMKIANDLRLLASGPRTGLAEIRLPELQPGSSIMPGKVNPVIPEAVTMVAAQIIGNDLTISVGALNGALDLNVMMPVIGYNLLQSIEIEATAARLFAERCIQGITADVEKCRRYAESSAALITAIAPAIGYENAARIFKRVLEEEKSVRQVVSEEQLLSPEQLDAILNIPALAAGRVHLSAKT